MNELVIGRKTNYDEKSNSLVFSKNEFEIKRVITVDGKKEKSVVATYNAEKDMVLFNPVETYIDRKELIKIAELIEVIIKTLQKQRLREKYPAKRREEIMER